MTSKFKKKNKRFLQPKYIIGLLAIIILINYFITTKKTSSAPPITNNIAQSKKPPLPVEKPKLAFYQRLQQGEEYYITNPKTKAKIIDLPLKEKNNNIINDIQEKNLQKTPTTPRYILQLGAFKKYQDAEKTQAALALKGIIVNITTFQNKEGVLWNRIRTSSFSELNQAKKYKDKLENKKISSLIIKKIG